MPETDPDRRIPLPTRTQGLAGADTLLLLPGTPRPGLHAPALPTPHRQEKMLAKYFIAAIPVWWNTGGWNWGCHSIF